MRPGPTPPTGLEATLPGTTSGGGRRGVVDAGAALPRGRRLLRGLDSERGAALAILLFGLLAFSPWWAGGRVFAPLDLLDGFYQPWAGEAPGATAHNHFTSDAVTQYLVYRRIAERSFAEDGWIGWSDLTWGGRPEYANTMASYGDWTVQLHRVLEFWTAWHLGLLGQFVIAALGMLVLLRSQGISPLVGLVGAVAYGANSQFVLWIYHRWQLGAFAWVPWLFWAMARYRAGHRGAWPLVPLFLALALIGGNLQTGAFALLAVAAAWLGWAVRLRARPRLDRVFTGHVAAWTVLGTTLAAFALVPSALAYVETLEVGLDRGGLGYARGPLQPFLAALLIPAQAFPTLLGHPRSIDLSRLLGLRLFDVAYFGFLPVVLAYRAAFVRGAPGPARWLIALGLLLPLSPLVGPLYHRVQILFVFGGVWAFAWYWERADAAGTDPVLRRVRTLFFALLGVWAVGSLVSLLFHDRLVGLIQADVAARAAAGRAGTFGFHRDWLLERARRLVVDSRIWSPRQAVAVAAALVGFAALALRARLSARGAAALLLPALVVELGVFAAGWVSVVDPREHPAYEELPDIAAAREIIGDGRVWVARAEDRPTIFFPSNTLAMYGIATLQQYETITFPGMWHAVGYPEHPRALGRLGVTHALSRPGLELTDGWTLAYRGERLWLWENLFALPRYLALPNGAAWPPGGTAPGDPAAARLLEGTRNRRLLEVPAGTGLLRVAENWHEGWRYRVDAGEWRTVAPARDRSMLIPLPASDEPLRVELRYRPAQRAWGWTVSLLAVLATVAAAGAILRPRPTAATSTRPATGTPRA